MKLWRAEVTTTVTFYIAAENEIRAHMIATQRREDILDPDVEVAVDRITTMAELGEDAPEDYPLMMTGDYYRTITEMLEGACPHGVDVAVTCRRCAEEAGQQSLFRPRPIEDAGRIE